MEVLLLTTLFSVVFAVLFLTLFLRDRQVRRFGGVERDALMPLDDGDAPLPVSGQTKESPPKDREQPRHEGCGCGGKENHSEKKKSCEGCLRAH